MSSICVGTNNYFGYVNKPHGYTGNKHLGNSRPQLETILTLEKSNLKWKKSLIFLDWQGWVCLFKKICLTPFVMYKCE